MGFSKKTWTTWRSYDCSTPDRLFQSLGNAPTPKGTHSWRNEPSLIYQQRQAIRSHVQAYTDLSPPKPFLLLHGFNEQVRFIWISGAPFFALLSVLVLIFIVSNLNSHPVLLHSRRRTVIKSVPCTNCITNSNVCLGKELVIRRKSFLIASNLQGMVLIWEPVQDHVPFNQYLRLSCSEKPSFITICQFLTGFHPRHQTFTTVISNCFQLFASLSHQWKEQIVTNMLIIIGNRSTATVGNVRSLQDEGFRFTKLSETSLQRPGRRRQGRIPLWGTFLIKDGP